MAVYCHYLTLLNILLFIWSSNSLHYGDFNGLKYIFHDGFSPSKAPSFLSSLFDSKGNLDYSKMTKHSRQRREAMKGSFNSKSTPNASATEYEFHGDNHTVAFLHWSGAKSKVIFIYTSNHLGIRSTSVGNVYFKNAYIWRSTDYGTTFTREDNKKFGESPTISGIRFCDTNDQRVVVFDQVNKTVYVSDDKGETYKANKVPFTPYDVMCVGSKKQNLLVAFDQKTSKLYYSKGIGQAMSWHFVSNDVYKYFWVPDITGKDSTTIFMEIQEKHYSSVLKYVTLPGDSSEVKIFDSNLGDFESHSFEHKGKYLFVKKRYPSMSLQVSYNGSSFKPARFPLKYNEKDYQVFDASDDEVFVIVHHQDQTTSSTFYNLYISDTSGTKFALSLTNILASSSYHWGTRLQLADIHKVESVRGALIANSIKSYHNHKYILTYITYDKGGKWQRLEAPPELRSRCRHRFCHLNLHMVHSSRYYQITSILSSQSAVGLIMAQGDINILSTSPDVFLSTDGGLTWSKVLDGRHDFVFADHGGLIIAVPIRTATSLVRYSWNEGSKWWNVTLAKNVTAYGLVTEPGQTTLIANIFGQHSSSLPSFEWLSVKLDFSQVFTRQCNGTKDYTTWTPNDERIQGDCLMGEVMVYERRKSNVSCFNGEEYEREISHKPCNCSMEDFTCDFGFIKTDGGECYSNGDEYIVPKNCPELTKYKRTSGYRKVPGDRCIGGIEDDFKAKDTFCPVQAPSGLSIDVKSATVPSYELTTFQLIQEKGSAKTTRYTWGFGDSSSLSVFTGIDNAKQVTHNYTKHGAFNVTVSANNSVGEAHTKTVVKVIDKIIKLRIIRPYGILVGLNTTFNITLYSYHGPEWDSYHGFVHFVWTFDVAQQEKPLLTWERVVGHVYAKPGKYKVKVSAINDVSKQSSTITIQVHDELRTVQLMFDDQLDRENKHTYEWREEFANMVLYEIVRLISIEQSRLEVFVSAQAHPYVEVNIIQRDSNNSITMDQAVEKIKKLVEQGQLEITFGDGKSTIATYAEVIDRKTDKKQTPKKKDTKVDIRLPIAIAVAAFVVIAFLAALIFYVYRRYRWFYTRYHRLSMNGGNGFVPLNRSSQDSLGVNMIDEAVAYHVPASDIANMEDSDDELILNEVGSGGRVLVIDADTEQDHTQTANAVQA